MKRAAIIGLGDISQIHIAGILANPEITLCGLCDINPEAQSRASGRCPFLYRLQRNGKTDTAGLCPYLSAALPALSGCQRSS